VRRGRALMAGCGCDHRHHARYALWRFSVCAAAICMRWRAACRPAMAAISLACRTLRSASARRNAVSIAGRFGAALMGPAAICVEPFGFSYFSWEPTLLALARSATRDPMSAIAMRGRPRDPDTKATSVFNLVAAAAAIFAAGMMLFQLPIAAMLPLMAGCTTAPAVGGVDSACIIGAQAIVALTSPRSGARPAMGQAAAAAGAFAALAIRGLMFAVVKDLSAGCRAVFDGITAAVFSVMVPLVVATSLAAALNLAQASRHRGRIGASLSTCSPAMSVTSSAATSPSWGRGIAALGLC